MRLFIFQYNTAIHRVISSSLDRAIISVFTTKVTYIIHKNTVTLKLNGYTQEWWYNVQNVVEGLRV